ncbi:hypothetical protein ACFX5U_14535 [Sphingobacterium sp. SG20118]|uniref:hypothetical protein n=1 Tax=Sphingobacterium sp. SG20118 TaxID=3367156 RepID=UPI0037DFC7DF
MRKTKEEIMDTIFKDIYSNWKSDIPELADAFEEVQFTKGEQLTNNWGDLYLLTEGMMGKYDKTCPVRYVLSGEPLLIPNSRHNFQFRAASDTKAYVIIRQALHAINQSNSKFFEFYTYLIDKQQQHIDYRQQLLSTPNFDKYEFVLKKYPYIRTLIKHKELALFMGVSVEYLRQLYRNGF